jgi:hypothetical protein
MKIVTKFKKNQIFYALNKAYMFDSETKDAKIIAYPLLRKHPKVYVIAGPSAPLSKHDEYTENENEINHIYTIVSPLEKLCVKDFGMIPGREYFTQDFVGLIYDSCDRKSDTIWFKFNKAYKDHLHYGLIVFAISQMTFYKKIGDKAMDSKKIGDKDIAMKKIKCPLCGSVNIKGNKHLFCYECGYSALEEMNKLINV